MYKALIIEDDEVISETIKNHLRKWEYIAESVTDFRNVMKTFVEFSPHIVIMDIALPFFNGYYWCSEIRKISTVPIIFLSSTGDNMNVVMAVNMGADDFISKPFDLSVLTAKVTALIRRTYSYQGTSGAMEHNGAILNLADTSLSFKGKRLELTKNDFKILQILMEHSGSVVSRDTIMTRLWESDSFIDDNTLTVNVTRLRKKLDEIGLTDFIKTKKGIGYMV